VRGSHSVALSFALSLALSLAMVAVLGGCALWQPSSEPVRVTPPGREEAAPLVPAQWTRAELHCESGDCAHWYRLELSSPQSLRIEIYSHVGPEVPDFDVRLEDSSGEVMWGYAETGQSPREIERVLAAGVYYLLVEAIGEQRGRLAYEAITILEPVGPVFHADRALPAKPARDPMRGPEVWIAAEIVQLEGSSGLASVIVLDVGARDEVRLGHRGELLQAGEVIATFELVEVEPGRSRGRLEGPPSDAITYETRARVRVPLE
jgi:hypothetical protein